MRQIQTDKPAVIYARFSSSKQNETSIEGQIQACYNFAKQEGYKVINEYIDRAKTGGTDERYSFQKMIRESYSHQFQYIIVYQLDRFARSRAISSKYKE
ncbi:MAG: recombinase family protein [Elusimicrobiota bacterium]|jgi:DNA invertase Pin-like site-specific DNA recombinase|nr:recombinase family protein [Elusimicrobiota bacterium]